MIPSPPPEGWRLSCVDVVAGYREMEILHGVAIKVGNCEIVTILGPNGSGKSTLLKVLSGLLPIRSGSVSLYGTDISDASPRERLKMGMCYVPQVKNVFATMSVQENLEMGALLLRGASLDTMLNRVFEYFPVLAERRHQITGKMSGGEQQMVAIGRALVTSPSLLLLDEPTAGLSPIAVDDLFRRIQSIAKAGVSIVLVEQNAAKALEISDRAYVLAAGINRLEGQASSLLEDKEIRNIYLGG